NLKPTNATLTKSGAGTLAVNALRSPAVAINAGKVKILSGGGAGGVSNVAALTIAPGATFDLNDNNLVTGNAPGSAAGGVYDGVSGMVQAGRLITSQTDATV